MVKAEDLIKLQKEREKIKFITFDKIYANIEKRVVKASSTNFYYIWFEIPCYMIGSPQYNLDDCKEYLSQKLEKNGFKVEFFEPNILLISWFPK